MHRIFALCFFLALAVPATSAFAFETPLTSPESRKLIENIGKSYRHYAQDLGCDDFYWGTISADSSVFTLKYVPAGVEPAKADRMAVITVYGLSGVKKKDTQRITQTISLLEGQYAKGGSVAVDLNYLSPEQEPMLYMEYTMGSGAQMIHGVAVFKRTAVSSAAFIQLQSRRTIPPDVAIKAHQMVNPTAKLPEEGKKPLWEKQ
jgi:hypothetical protein